MQKSKRGRSLKPWTTTSSFPRSQTFHREPSDFSKQPKGAFGIRHEEIAASNEPAIRRKLHKLYPRNQEQRIRQQTQADRAWGYRRKGRTQTTQSASKESKSATVYHQEWTETLLARDTLDGWSGRLKEELFLRSCHRGPKSAKLAQTHEQQERRTQARRGALKGLSANSGFEKTVACQSPGWSPPVLGLVARQF